MYLCTYWYDKTSAATMSTKQSNLVKGMIPQFFKYRIPYWSLGRMVWGRLRLRTTLKILKITYSTLDRGDRPEKRGPVGANRAVRSAGAHRAPEFRSRALVLAK